MGIPDIGQIFSVTMTASGEPFGPIVPGPAGDDMTVLLILARYYPGPITNPEHAKYVADYVKAKTGG